MLKPIILAATLLAGTAAAQTAPRAQVAGGTLEGIAADAGVERFLGVPFAAPPIGVLRWREPQPAPRWSGVRQAIAFGARCMQQPLFRDMAFRSPPSSEDCLYLNVWRPAGITKAQKLPVLLYIYGGGFQAGDASEKRYDGARLAARGMIVVTVNYRLNVFGFLAHPALTAESGHRASGNYGLLDQAAALAWVKRNAAAFGGDAKRITIGGESAGSMSVSAMMASPLTRGDIAGAIGESGALMGNLAAPTRETAEAAGQALGVALNAPTLADLRAVPAERLLNDAAGRFGPDIDGNMLTEQPEATFAAGRQAKVPLLVGTNSQEGGYGAILAEAAPTAANYRLALARLYGADADKVATLYPAATDAEVIPAASALASDRFLSFATWRWFDLHRRTSAPTYLYQYRRVRPRALDDVSTGAPQWGAVHSAEIEYAFDNLDTNPAYAWTPDDRSTAQVMSGYWANFVKAGDPNGTGLPAWPAAGADGARIRRQAIDVEARTEPFVEQQRYAAMALLLGKQAGD